MSQGQVQILKSFIYSANTSWALTAHQAPSTLGISALTRETKLFHVRHCSPSGGLEGWTRSNGTEVQSQAVPSVPSPDCLAPQMRAFHPLSSTLFCNSCLCVLPVCGIWTAWEQRRCLALCSEHSVGPDSERKKVKSLSRVQLFGTPWTVAYQAPLSMEFSRQEYWSGLPYPSPGVLPDPGIEPVSPALQADTLPSAPPGKPCWQCPVVIGWMNPALARGGIR